MIPQNPQHIQQFLSTVLSQRTLPYAEPHKWHIRNQLVTLTTTHPSLTPKTNTYTYTDGRSVTLLQTEGTIPMLYNSVTYNIPIVIWLPDSFPTQPPLVYVNPTRDMVIKRGHPFVNPNGAVTVPYLSNWIFPGSNLVNLARELSEYFATDPPLYSQRAPTRAQSPRLDVHNINNNNSPVAVQNINNSAGFPRPVIPPPRTYPPSPYGLSMSDGGRNNSNSFGRVSHTEDPTEVFKRNAINKIVESVHSDVNVMRKSQESEMEGMFSAQAVLRERGDVLARGVREMQAEKEGLEHKLQIMLMNADVLEGWVRENEGKVDEMRGADVDEAFLPLDGLSRQMMDSTAGDLAIEDMVYSLDKAVQEGVVPFDQYLRSVRSLSREQFFHRALAGKVRAAQMQAQIGNMAARVQHRAL